MKNDVPHFLGKAPDLNCRISAAAIHNTSDPKDPDMLYSTGRGVLVLGKVTGFSRQFHPPATFRSRFGEGDAMKQKSVRKVAFTERSGSFKQGVSKQRVTIFVW